MNTYFKHLLVLSACLLLSSNLLSQSPCASPTCSPVPMTDVCADGTNTVTLTCDSNLSGIIWYNSSGTQVGTGCDLIVSNTLVGTGVVGQSECFYYEADDSNSCPAESCCPVNVTVLNCMTCTVAGVNPVCNTGMLGSATVTPANGVAPFTYAWSDGQTTVSATGLSAGTYTVTVTDAAGGTTTCDVTLTEPSALTCSVTAVDANCFGTSDGSALVAASGGTAGYTYAWSNSVTTASNPNLGAGTYTVTVTDANGCTAVCNGTVAEPAEMVCDIVPSDPNCNGGIDGNLDLTVTGGTGAYTFDWDNDGAEDPDNDTEDLSGVGAGVYRVTITDANGCTAWCTATLAEPTALTCSAVGTSPTDCDVSDGVVTATAAGGTSPYTYSINGGPVQSSMAFGGLGAGTYTVTTIDDNGCTTECMVAITSPESPMCTIVSTDITCNGGTDGSLTATGSGGTGAYEYSIDGGVTYQTSGAFSNLPAGSYTITVAAGGKKGCSSVCNVTITEPAALTCSNVGTDVTCNGASDGTATVTPAGGVAPYTFAWGTTPTQTAMTATMLPAGSFSVTVTDANGCTTACNITIAGPPALACALVNTDVSCDGGDDGSITVTPSGGTAPYEYSLNGDPFQAGATFTGLVAGSYVVTIRDANQCVSTCSISVVEPDPLTCSTVATDATDCMVDNGTVTITAVGGIAPYSYAVNGGTAQSFNVFSGLGAGTLTVLVTDDNGCTTECTAVINSPSAPMCEITTSADVSCNGGMDGSLTAVGTGGSGTYEYSVDATVFQASGSFTGLSAGSYTVTVRNVGNPMCTSTCNVTITEPSELTCLTDPTDTSCEGGNNGEATVAPAGGTAPYTYVWDDTAAQSTATAINLTAGTYNVTVTDANGCTAVCVAEINSPLPLTCSLTATDATCNGADDGTITVATMGGAMPFEYSINGGAYQTSSTFNGLPAGSHIVTVRDDNMCISNCSIIINEPVAMNCTVSATPASDCSVDDGSLTITATGGNTPYEYSVDGVTFQVSNVINGLGGGTYTVTARDANGCETTCTGTVTTPSAPTCSIDNVVNVSCAGLDDGSFVVTGADGNGAYEFSIDGTTFSSNPGFSGLTAGSYTVTVRNVGQAMCTSTCNIIIEEPDPLTCTITKNDATCNGAADGDATVVAMGGALPYTYLWDSTPIQTTATATGLMAGSYTVTVTDANGCTTECTAMIMHPTPATCSLVTMDVSCNGGMDGLLVVTGTGGVTPYEYSLSGDPFQAGNVYNNLPAGMYIVNIKDANDCMSSCSINIVEPSPVTCAATATDATDCGIDDGTVTAAGAGGTPGYEYSINGGAYQTSGSFAGLGAGTYTVTVRDANGCTSECSATVNTPSAPMCTIFSSFDVSCNGLSDGNLTVEGSGGSGNYEYSIDGTNFVTTATFVNLSAGSYTITVRNVGDPMCTSTCNVTISEPDPLACMTTSTDVSCAGDFDGTATVVGMDGTMPYTYAWSDGQTTSTAASLAAGTYMVTVTDANGCMEICDVTVVEPLGLTCDLTVVNQVCETGMMGSLTVTSAGGVMPFEYSLDAANWQAGNVFNNLMAGTYTVYVRDMNLCETTCTAEIELIPCDTPLLSIGSTVFSDDNNNGIQDPGEDSLGSGSKAGKVVVLDLYDAATGALVATTTTDANGSYLFQNLPPGDYYIEFVPPASLPVSSTPTNTADDGVDGDDNGSQSDSNGDGLTDGVITSPVITLAEGTEPVGEPGKNGGKDDADDANGDMTIDFGLVPLMSIGSTVFSDDNDNGIQDPGEDSLGSGTTAGKVVTLELYDAITGALVATTTTDANGSYLFDNLLPGDYYIEFIPPASLPTSSTPTNIADDQMDGDDNGIQQDLDGDGVTDGPITSPLITLEGGTEPIGEPGKNGGKDDADDANGDMTIDFGLVPAPMTYDLALVKNVVTPGPYMPGDDVTYAIMVCNQGDVDANFFEITDHIPAGMMLSTTAGTNAGWVGGPTGSVTYAYNNLLPAADPDACATINITLTIDPAFMGTTLVNESEITDDDGDDVDSDPTMDDGPDTDNDMNDGADDEDPEPIFIGQTYDLALVKQVVTPGPYAVGQDVTYAIMVCNQGTLDANFFEITDHIPAGMMMSTTAGTNAGWLGGPTGSVTYAYNTLLPAADPDACATIMITLTIDPAFTGTSLVNESEITDDDGDDVDSDPTMDDGPDTDDSMTDGADDEDPEEIMLDMPLMSIGSTVFSDDNNNGIQDPGEDALGSGSKAGKSVTLDLYDSFGNFIATTTTDANGSYLFDNLPPGDYYIEFFPPASLPVSSTPTNTADDQVDGDDNGSQIDNDGDGLTDGIITSPLITLSPGTEPVGEPESNGGKDAGNDDNGDMTIDFGLVPLMSIGSTVFSDDNNNGIQDPGEDSLGSGSTAGKAVMLELYDAVTGALVATTTTDANGSYIFDNLLPGDYYIEFTPPASLPTSSTPTNTADDQVDGDDNGMQQDLDGDGVTDGPITSPVITLAPGTEPVGEPGKNGGKDGADDANGDMTIDFGLVPAPMTYDLALVKNVVTPGPYAPGQDITYAIMVCNQGDIDANFFEITDHIPAGMMMSTTAGTNAGWVGGPTGSVTYAYNTLLPAANPDACATVMITLTIDPTFAGTSLVNESEITDDDGDDIDSDPTMDDGPDTDNDMNDGADDEDPEEIMLNTPLMSIGSTVFSDDNNNGIQDPGEDSLGSGSTAGKVVTLELYDSAGNLVATTTTDANGSYIFNNLPPGDYYIEFIPPTSLPVSSTPTNTADDQTDGDDNGIQADTNADGLTDGPITSPIITLAPGAEPVGEPGKNGGKDGADDANGDMTIDFGLVPLVSLGSTVFSDDNNNGIQDPGEDSLGSGTTAGKVVTLDLYDATTGALVATTTTDANGSYLFDNLLPGDYYIEFNPPASLPTSSTPTSTADDQVDGDDNGIQQDLDGDGVTDGPITSPVINLCPGKEPTGEPGKNGGKDGADDDNGDMTVDFGLVPSTTYDLALVKQVVTPGPYTPGQDVTYAIMVCNQGTEDANFFEITDHIPAGMMLSTTAGTNAGWVGGPTGSVTYAYNTLLPAADPDACVTINITLTIDPAFMGSSLVNNAEISDDDGDDTDSDPTMDDGPDTDDDMNDGADDEDPESINIGQTFDLALIKTLSTSTPGPFSPGDLVTFDITVTNQGTIDAYDVNIYDFIPTGLILNDAFWTDLAGTAVTTTPIPSVAAGTQVVTQISFTIDPAFTGTSITNNAEIATHDDDMDPNNFPPTDVDSTPGSEDGSSSDPNDNDTADTTGGDDYDPETIVIGQNFDLALIKTLSSTTPGPFSPGDMVTFDITVINQGSVDAYNVNVADFIPAGLMLNDALWASAGGVATLVTPIATIAAGTQQVVTISFSIDATFMGSSITNNAEISEADDDTDPNNMGPTDSDSTPGSENGGTSDSNDNDTADTTGGDDYDPETIVIGQNFDLALMKQLAAGQSSMVNPGDAVTFTITILNQGSLNADNIEITDYIPTGFTFNPASNLAWIDNGNGTATVTLTAVASDLPAGGLAPGGQVTVDIILDVAHNAPQGMMLVNWAEISDATDGSGGPVTDSDSNPDTNQNDDTFGGDDEVNNGGGDEDDHDPAEVTISEFDLALTKTVAAGQSSMVAPGDLVTFTITVINQGDITADNIEIVDYIPACMVISDTNWTGTNPVSQTLSIANGGLPAGGLAAGASASVDITVMISSTADATCDFTNWAEIASTTDEDGDPIPDSDSTPDNDNTNDGYGGTDVTDNSGGDEDDHDDAEVSFMPICDLALIKETNTFVTNGNGSGGTVTFTMTVFNQGGCDAYNIQVVDYIPVGWTLNDAAWTQTGGNAYHTIPGPLAPNNSVSVDITFDITSFDPNSPQYNYSEIAGSENGDGSPQMDMDSDPDDDPADDGTPSDDETNNNAADEDDHDLEELEIMDLAIDKSIVTQAPYTYGQLIEYSICITNEGNMDAYNVQIGDHIPAGMTFSTANNTGWTGAAPTAWYTFAGPVVPNQVACTSIFLTLDPNPSATSDYTNVTEITDVEDGDGNNPDDWDSAPSNDDGDQSEDDEDSEVIDIYDLALAKVYSSYIDNNANSVLSQGDDVIFTITVYNQGTVDANNIQITDYLPTGMTLSAADTNGWVAGATGTATNTIPFLAAFGSTTVDIQVTIANSFMGTSLTNWAEISSDDGTDVDSNEDNDQTNDTYVGDNDVSGGGGDEDDHDPEEVVLQQYFDLALIKEFTSSNDLDGSGTISQNDEVLFTITVFNQGTLDGTNIEITDYIPTGMTLSTNDFNGWSGPANGPVTNTIALVPAGGAPVTVDILLTVDPNFMGQYLTNWAEISNDNNGGDVDSTPDGTQFNGPGETDDLNEDNMTDNMNGDEDDHDPAQIMVGQVWDLALMKMVAPGQTGPYGVFDDISYTITVYNQGTLDAYNVNLIDYVQTGHIISPNDFNGWATDANGNYTNVIAGPIAAGGSASIDIVMRVTQDAYTLQLTELTNIAEITGSEDAAGNPQTDMDSTADSTVGNDSQMDNVTDGSGGDEDDEDPAYAELEPLDPLGYIYCEKTGDLVMGGLITITGPGNIIYGMDPNGVPFDGRSGMYQFFVDAPGVYDITWSHPSGIPLSTNCNPFAGVYDPSNIDGTATDLDGVVNNQIVLGSDTINGGMIDYTCAGNPYFLSVDIQPADPPIINNNNIPVLCSAIASIVCEDANLNGIAETTDPGFDGITVSLYNCNDLTNPIATQVTANGGQYDFGGLIAGCYRLYFDNPQGYAVLGAGVVGADGWTGDINLAWGECNTSVTYCLTQANAGLGNYVWHDRNGDGIQDNGEPAIGGVKVYLHNDNGFILDFTFTDNSGFYLFDELRPGHYYVRFEDPEGYTLTGGNRGNNDNTDSDVDHSNGPGTTSSTWLDPAELDMSWDAGYYNCVPVGDFVWADTNNNGSQDNNENGINGLKVNLYKVINGISVLYDYTFTGHKPGTGSDDGYFKFCAPPGQYYLHFEAGSNLSAVSSGVGGSENDSDITGANGTNTTSTFTILSGEHRCDIDGGYRINSSLDGNTQGYSSGDDNASSLIGFNGANDGSSNNLDWTIEHESDTEYYTISRLNAEGIYTEIGKVLSQNLGTKETSYFFRDFDFEVGVNTYKLESFDLDNKLQFVDKLRIETSDSEAYQVSLYPNITTSYTSLKVSVEKTSDLNVSLVSIDGSKVLDKVILERIEAGSSIYRIKTDELNAGIYFVHVKINSDVITKKLIVVEY